MRTLLFLLFMASCLLSGCSGGNSVNGATMPQKELSPLTSYLIPRSEGELSITENTLFVTHASKIFTGNLQFKQNLDKEIRKHKERGNVIVYVMNADEEQDANWLTEDRSPTMAVNSLTGDLKLSVQTAEVTVAGGYFTLCLDRTIERIISSARKNELPVMRINLPLDSIYEGKGFFIAQKVPEKEKALLFPLMEDQTLADYRSLLTPESFIKGLKSYLEYKSDISYEVFLDGKKIFENYLNDKTLIRFYFR